MNNLLKIAARFEHTASKCLLNCGADLSVADLAKKIKQADSTFSRNLYTTMLCLYTLGDIPDVVSYRRKIDSRQLMFVQRLYLQRRLQILLPGRSYEVRRLLYYHLIEIYDINFNEIVSFLSSYHIVPVGTGFISQKFTEEVYEEVEELLEKLIIEPQAAIAA